MAYIEIDSFVQKFKNLWHAGLKATLNVETENGEAFVTLKAGLGYSPPPLNFPVPHGHVLRTYRGPSYHCRQERRQAARADAAAGNVASRLQAEQVSDTDETSGEKIAEEANETSEMKKNEKEAEQAVNNFECAICDFMSNWENGLNVHMTRKHRRIDQIDGNIAEHEDSNQDDKYAETKHYWEKGRLGSAYQAFLDANDIIDNCDISEDEKEKEKAKVLESRKTAIGPQFVHFPPWSLRS